MSSNDSTRKTLIVAFSLCIVCSVFVSAAAVMLKPVQEVNKALDRKRNILAAAGMLVEGKSVEEQFAEVSTRVVDLRTGKFADDIDPATYDQRKAAKDPAQSTRLPRSRTWPRSPDGSTTRWCIWSRTAQASSTKSSCRFVATACGRPCTALSPWKPMPIRWPVLVSMNTAKHPAWVVKSITHAGKPSGPAKRSTATARWQLA